MEAGRWWTLFSYQFLHAGISHIAMNAIGAFTFGAPVVRLLGLRNKDIALFYIFFLLCGAVAGAGQILLTEGGVIGASGAVCGLWGAASRLLGRRGGLAPFFDRMVLTQAAAFAVVNLIFGLAGPLLVGVSIGWQAHIVGYVAGLLLIGVFGRLAGRLR